FNPYYHTLEINLGVVNSALHNNAEAESHFQRALHLAPSSADAELFYARWLNATGRVPEAISNARRAIDLRADHIDSRYLLMNIYAKLGDRENLRVQAAETLAMFPSDATARAWLDKAPTLAPVPARAESNAAGQTGAGIPTAEGYLEQSFLLYRAGKFADSIGAAREALKLRPNYAEAWNNIAAAYNSMSDWDQAIASGVEAVALDPSNQLARNNLAWARAQKEKSAVPR